MYWDNYNINGLKQLFNIQDVACGKRGSWDVKSGVLAWGKPAAFVRPSDRDFGVEEQKALHSQTCFVPYTKFSAV